MFNLRTAFNQPLTHNGNSWNLANVTNMTNMFNGATAFSIANYDIFLYSQANNSGTNSNITITVSSNSSDATSRATLTSAPKSWNITDLGNTASVAPTFTRTTIAGNNTTIAVTFNEAVFDTNGGSGALEVSDFALSISGGVATVNATPSSISISGNVYTLGLTLTGTPSGAETLTVVPSGSTAIYDATGNAASTTQSNNTVSLNDQAAPIVSGTTVASNNTTIAVTFNEAVYNTMVEVARWKRVTLLYPSRVEWQQLMLHHLVYRFLEMYIP